MLKEISKTVGKAYYLGSRIAFYLGDSLDDDLSVELW